MIISRYKKKVKLPNQFILTYIFKSESITRKYIEIVSKKLKYAIIKIDKKKINSIEKFIYGISNCKAAITNSFHGTIFSIIFKKPFVTFIFKGSPKERLISLKKLLNIDC